MIELCHVCDLCGTKSATSRQWHASSVKVENMNYAARDSVPTPQDWRIVGFRIICESCVNEVAKIVNPQSPLVAHGQD